MTQSATINGIDAHKVDTDNLRDKRWLQEKVCSPEYDDGFSFRELLHNG